MMKRIHVTEVAIFRLVFSGCWMRVVQILLCLAVVDILFAASKYTRGGGLLGAD
jgi:hypothetical protein